MMKPLRALLALGLLIGCGKNEPPSAPSAQASPLAAMEQPPAPPPPPAKAYEKKVALKVQAQTWQKEEQPFDVADVFTKILDAANVQTVPETAPSKDAHVLLDYKETKGQGYSTFGIGEANGYGTNIELNVTVLSADTAEVILAFTISSSPPMSIQGGTDLYTASTDALKDTDLYKAAGPFVAAALGMKSALPGVAAAALWFDSREKALEVAKAVGYEPAGARERAMLAIAREDYDACVALGTPAAAPLIQFMDRYYYPKEVASAARALGEIGDPSARTVLQQRLEYLKNGDFGDEEDTAAGVAVINALAKVGDMFVLADLDMLAKSDKADVAAAATRAAKMIRTRATAK